MRSRHCILSSCHLITLPVSGNGMQGGALPLSPTSNSLGSSGSSAQRPGGQIRAVSIRERTATGPNRKSLFWCQKCPDWPHPLAHAHRPTQRRHFRMLLSLQGMQNWVGIRATHSEEYGKQLSCCHMSQVTWIHPN